MQNCIGLFYADQWALAVELDKSFIFIVKHSALLSYLKLIQRYNDRLMGNGQSPEFEGIFLKDTWQRVFVFYPILLMKIWLPLTAYVHENFNREEINQLKYSMRFCNFFSLQPWCQKTVNNLRLMYLFITCELFEEIMLFLEICIEHCARYTTLKNFLIRLTKSKVARVRIKKYPLDQFSIDTILI